MGTFKKLNYLAQNSIPMNIIFCYLYRYSAHFKEYHEVVFSNTKHIPLSIIENIITSNLKRGRWFIPDEWQLPNLLYTGVHNTTTLPYHEFLHIRSLPARPVAEGDITLLLHTIQLNAAVHKVQ